MADKLQPVRSFGRFDSGTCTVSSPTDIAQVSEVFEYARKSGQSVTIRGGGHSFDAQALHEGDSNTHVIMKTDAFEPKLIKFDPQRRDRVTLGCGVQWRQFVNEAIRHARENNAPISLPGSIQTGGDTTVGGSLAGDCVSRSSGTLGKESRWIESFRILTPDSISVIDVSEERNPDLFHAVIGGQGYIGFVTDITYKLTPLDRNLLRNESGIYRNLYAETKVSTHGSIGELIQKQMELIHSEPSYPRGVSAEWFGGSAANPGRIHGAVCDSSFVEQRFPKRLGFPLYHDLQSPLRYWTEVLVRYRFWSNLVDWLLYGFAKIGRKFEDPVEDFLFFMDGDSAARKEFERRNPPHLFPLVQQTFVVPKDKTESFTQNCIRKIHRQGLCPTESDMLYALEDECLLSANYRLNGFAVSFAFEQKGDFFGPRVFELLRELSRDCLDAGGRIHLPKNSHVDREVCRLMFKGQIEKFEEIKRHYDRDLLLRNPFSDRLFDFKQAKRASA